MKLIVFLIVFFPSVAFSQQLVERFDHNFDQVHDSGLYWRIGAGTSYTHTQIIPGFEGDDLDKGWSTTLEACVGGYIANQLVLHASLGSQLGIQRGLITPGVGLTYYFNEHSNWLIGANLGVASIYDAAPDIDLFDQWAISGSAYVGTGWWISPTSSLGVMLSVKGVHMDLDADGVLFAGWLAGLQGFVSWN